MVTIDQFLEKVRVSVHMVLMYMKRHGPSMMMPHGAWNCTMWWRIQTSMCMWLHISVYCITLVSETSIKKGLRESMHVVFKYIGINISIHKSLIVWLWFKAPSDCILSHSIGPLISKRFHWDSHSNLDFYSFLGGMVSSGSS